MMLSGSPKAAFSPAPGPKSCVIFLNAVAARAIPARVPTKAASLAASQGSMPAASAAMLCLALSTASRPARYGFSVNRTKSPHWPPPSAAQ